VILGLEAPEPQTPPCQLLLDGARLRIRSQCDDHVDSPLVPLWIPYARGVTYPSAGTRQVRCHPVPGPGAERVTTRDPAVGTALRGATDRDILHRVGNPLRPRTLMEQPPRDALDRGRELLARRRHRLGRLTGRPVDPPAVPDDLPEERRRFLVEEAMELYWNELSWEQVTEEEGLSDNGLVELTFPGFLAFIEGLLLREVMPDSTAPARPRPGVVEDVLGFLAARCIQLHDRAEDEDARVEGEVTERLIDLVLYRQHDIDVEEFERLEEEGAPTREPDGP
jgi:hypothetical protein